MNPLAPSYYLAVCGLNHSVRRCKLRPPCWVYFELVSSQKLCVKLRNELLLIDAPSKSSHFRVDFYGKIWESYENVCHRILLPHMYYWNISYYPSCSHYYMSNCYQRLLLWVFLSYQRGAICVLCNDEKLQQRYSMQIYIYTRQKRAIIFTSYISLNME